MVAGLYRKTIEQALSQTTELRFVNQGWKDAQIAELVQVLPLCVSLRRLALDDNEKLTAKGAETLAAALAAGAAPRLTHLGHHAGKSFTQSKRLRAACEARGIALARFAGITAIDMASKRGSWQSRSGSVHKLSVAMRNTSRGAQAVVARAASPSEPEPEVSAEEAI